MEGYGANNDMIVIERCKQKKEEEKKKLLMFSQSIQSEDKGSLVKMSCTGTICSTSFHFSITEPYFLPGRGVSVRFSLNMSGMDRWMDCHEAAMNTLVFQSDCWRDCCGHVDIHVVKICNNSDDHLIFLLES